MKQKNKSEELATKNDLELLEQSLSGEMHEVRGDINLMREEHREYKDEVLTKLDDIAGQLESLQEDKTLSIHQTSQLREEVDNHEKRIKSLEHSQHAA